MKGIKKRDRPSLGNSESLVRSYRVSKKQSEEFENWCKCRGLITSECIRVSVSLLIEKGNLAELLRNPELREIALNLLN